MKTILVTGATGFLGHHIVEELLKKNDNRVIAIEGRKEDRAFNLPQHERLVTYPSGTLYTELIQPIDVAINCAFLRTQNTELMTLNFDNTEHEIFRFEKLKIDTVINISTQGVYKRLPAGTLSSEDSPIAPIDMYSMSKYATEKMFKLSSIPHVINVRLASLMMSQRFLYHFVQCAKKGESFDVVAPKQYASLLDVNDAAAGLAAIASMTHEKHYTVYNLGPGMQHSLLDYAESVKRIGANFGYDVEFDVDDNRLTICAGMDCTKLMHDTGWKPKVLKDEMITRLFEEPLIEDDANRI